jgi:adenine-specific DNA-methyltransferase
MEKLKMHSPNLTQDNIARIRDLFPGCVTEAKGEDGSVKLAVDFDQLRQELAESIVEGPQERYHLNWPGKREALLAANAPIAKTLRPCRDESVNFDTTKNLFIEGDNLDALKLLQETYLGKVKMIYIDPPYNTGNDFIYEDDFAEGAEEFLRRSNQKDEQGNRLVANTAANGRFHSDWLSLIYPRLRMARNLLTEDGAIFINIDDSELGNLRKICDEIFGEDNFVANVAWKHTQQSKNDERYFARVYNSLLIYRKSDCLVKFRLPRTEEDNRNYSNPDNDPKGKWRAGDVRSPSYRKTLCFEIATPSGKKIPPPDNGWRWSEDTVKDKIKSGEIKFSADETKIIRKIYLSDQEGRTPENLWDGELAGTSRQANAELKELFGGNVPFDTPKPTALLKRIAQLFYGQRDYITLDFFAGSGSTADAVMQLNAEDGGSRRFILVQLPEPCAEDSEGYKAGYKTIAEVSKERIRCAGEKISKSAKSGDTGFRTLKIDTSNMADVYYAPDALDKAKFDLFVDNIKPDRTPEDLLFQVMLDWGVDLALPITKQSIQGKDVFFVDGNVLAACFDASGSIDEAFVKELAKQQPLRVVFRDAGYKNSAVKINVEQIFKLLSPATEVKCI